MPLKILDQYHSYALIRKVAILHGCMQEHIPIEEVFEQLRCSKNGITDEEAEARIQIFGQNKLEEKSVLILPEPLIILHLAPRFTLLSSEECFINFRDLMYHFQTIFLIDWFLVVQPQESKILKFLGFMWNPLSWVMEAAAIMAIVLANGQVKSQIYMSRDLPCSFFLSSFIVFFPLSSCWMFTCRWVNMGWLSGTTAWLARLPGNYFPVGGQFNY